MKQTPLHAQHLKLKARMSPFGGWDMPIQYTNLIEEHLATRNNAGLFDISHMGEFFIKGPDAKKFLQTVLTNDLDRLSNSKCFYSAMCTPDGGTIDDLFVYQISAENYMLVVNAGTLEKDLAHLTTHAAKYDVTIENESDNIAKLDLQGPKSEIICQKATSYDLSTLKRFHFIEDQIYGAKAFISRTGYTGEQGFELYIDADQATMVWKKLLADGKSKGLLPVGLGARDTLRIEAGYSLYGHELGDTISPIEAGIGFVVRDKKIDYIGKSILLEQKANNAPRSIIFFEMQDKSIPRTDYPILQNNTEIGHVTSGTFSPSLQKGIGMGLIKNKLEIGSEIQISIRNRIAPAIAVKKPFVSNI